MQLVHIKTITAEIECLTGTHVGGGDSEIHIGGVDNQVIRNPVTLEPYIPGSSLKGKMRSLLEWRSGAVQDKPLDWNRYVNEKNPKKKEAIFKILQLFGTGASDDAKKNDDAPKFGPARASFWDCKLTEKWKKRLEDGNLLFTEVKSENTINRIKATAIPRHQERVPAGTLFEFKLSLKCVENDNQEDLLNLVLEGMRLLELDGIGGSVSRGYGKIQFNDVKIDGKPCTQWGSIKPFGN